MAGEKKKENMDKPVNKLGVVGEIFQPFVDICCAYAAGVGTIWRLLLCITDAEESRGLNVVCIASSESFHLKSLQTLVQCQFLSNRMTRLQRA